LVLGIISSYEKLTGSDQHGINVTGEVISEVAMKIIDAWSQILTPRFMQAPWLATLRRWTGTDKDNDFPNSVSATLAAMDNAAVETALLSAWHGPQGALITNDEVAEAIAQAPQRFAGLATVDLRHPVQAVAELRRVLSDHNFVGVRVVPWLWDLPPNDRRYYPIYVSCVEFGVPFCTQIGHTGPLCRSEPGRLIPYIDEVLLDFPDLVIVGGHVGFPWIDEVISLAHKYPNFHVDTSAYAAHRLPTALVEFMQAEGRERVLFGSNWPMLSPSRCLAHLNVLNLNDEVKRLFLGGNAARIFGRLQQRESKVH